MRLAVGITCFMLCAGAPCLPGRALAQQPVPLRPVDRASAVQAALAHAASLAVAGADTAMAFAQFMTAQVRQNPTLSASYTQSAPQYHASADLPLDLTGVRSARLSATRAGRQTAWFRFASARVAAALRADTAYTLALARRERSRLSSATAMAADSLRVIAGLRRDAGDVSDLDVDLAELNAGAEANVAATDSLSYVTAVLELQAAMGLGVDSVLVSPVGSLDAPSLEELGVERARSDIHVTMAAIDTGRPLAVAAAHASVDAATFSVLAERRSVWGQPSISAGFESGDPSGSEKGLLATIGVALPLPVLDRNRGPIAQAEAARGRASAELELAARENRIGVALARRSLVLALERVTRDEQLVLIANSVAARSVTAYREGASSLPAVLQAQRDARDVLANYVGDLAGAWVAAASLRALTITEYSPELPTR